MDPDDDYFLELGKFIQDFAETEWWMHQFLCSITGLQHRSGRAVFSGLKVDGLTQAIRRFYEANEFPITPEIAEALHQLSEISSIRNDIVHFGTYVEDGDNQPSVSNKRAVHTLSRVRSRRIDDKTLVLMRADLAVVRHRLAFVAQRDLPPEKRPELKNDPDKWRLNSWSYKPVPPTQTLKGKPPDGR